MARPVCILDNDWTLETLVDLVDECYAACLVAPQRAEAAAEEMVVIPDRARNHPGTIQYTTDPGRG